MDIQIRCSDARRSQWASGIQRCVYDDRPSILSVTDTHGLSVGHRPRYRQVTAEDVRLWRLAPRVQDAQHWSQGSAEAYRMATGHP